MRLVLFILYQKLVYEILRFLGPLNSRDLRASDPKSIFSTCFFPAYTEDVGFSMNVLVRKNILYIQGICIL